MKRAGDGGGEAGKRSLLRRNDVEEEKILIKRSLNN